ncbi:hypothetical protein PENTCL1PPCAC_10447, partial [Pristionchus entomophagus]
NSLLRMREVCKLAKEMIDDFILKIRDMKLNSFAMESHRDSGTTVSFQYEERDLWMICLTLALTKLGIDIEKIGKNKKIIFLGYYIHITLSSEEVIMFLEYMRPIIRRTKIRRIAFCQVESDIICKCAEFFE